MGIVYNPSKEVVQTALGIEPAPITPISPDQDPVNPTPQGADPTNAPNDGGTGPTDTGTAGGVAPQQSGGGEHAPPPSDYADNIDSDPTLGSLSSRYESNGNPTVIGRDNTGGYSYGEYQIATKTGTFGNYMDYLQQNDPDVYNELQAAGGESAALAGDPAFKSKWKEVMSDPNKAKTQHDFIQASHYNPAVNRISSSTGLDITSRSKPVQDAIWSTAVQHGPGGANTITQRAINRSGKTADTITDEELITAIYDERGADSGRKYFRSSTSGVRASVVNRFSSEKSDALSALG